MTVQERIRRADLPVRTDLLEEIVQRVVRLAAPSRIFVFGSAARGQLRPDSDLDLLVVKDGDYDQRRVTADLYRSLADLDMDVDVLVVSSSQVERYRDSTCLVLHPALREGKLIYDNTSL